MAIITSSDRFFGGGSNGASMTALLPPLVHLHSSSSSERRLRLQTFIAAAWVVACALALLAARPRLDTHAAQQLWLFFQPMAPPLAMLWLWAHNVHFFEAAGMPYALCFAPRDRGALPSAASLARVAAALTAAAAASLATAATLAARGAPSAPAVVGLLTYAAAAALLLAPGARMYGRTRRLFASTLGCVLLPLRSVSWADFLLADMLTSLAKSTYDAERVACSVLLRPAPAQLHSRSAYALLPHACSALTWHALLALLLPFALRLAQCVSIWRAGGPRVQLLNALKYALALPALLLTALEHEAHVHGVAFPLRRVWVAVMLVSSLYSFYWDVEMDWDMPWLAQPGAARPLAASLGRFGAALPLPRPKADAVLNRGGGGAGCWYGTAVATDLLLRFTWAHRLLGDLEAHSAVLMAVALLEVLRRWQWVFGRIEKELRTLGALHGGSGAAEVAAEGGVALLSGVDGGVVVTPGGGGGAVELTAASGAAAGADADTATATSHDGGAGWPVSRARSHLQQQQHGAPQLPADVLMLQHAHSSKSEV